MEYPMTEYEKLKATAHLLIKNNYKEKELGLLTGKTGKVIFFFLYYQYTSKHIYKEFAEALLDDICEGLNDEVYFDYRRGICGIGWGIDYLIHQQFVEIEDSSILEIMDDTLFNHFLKIIHAGYCSPKDIALYAISRYSHEDSKFVPSCETGFLKDITGFFDTCPQPDAAFIKENLRFIQGGNRPRCNHHFFLANEIRREQKPNLISEGLQLLLHNDSMHG